MGTLGAMNSTPHHLVTLTPAPSWDITYSLTQLDPGLVHRAQTTTREFAGKGVNVSRALALAGISAPAVVPLSPADQAGVAGGPGLVAVDVQAELRTNATVVESGGQTTKINQAASHVSAREWRSLVRRTAELVAGDHGSWVLVSGTIPESGASAAERVSTFMDSVGPDTRIAVDTSGEPLTVFARSGRVDLIKPNVSELAGCVGRALATLGEVVDAAQEVVGWGVETVLVSLGSQGFLAVTGEQQFWARSAPVTAVNTIGAGDASVAGFFRSLLSGSFSLADSVATAAAWGALKVTQPGSQLRTLEPLPTVSVSEQIQADQPVTSD